MLSNGGEGARSCGSCVDACVDEQRTFWAASTSDFSGHMLVEYIPLNTNFRHLTTIKKSECDRGHTKLNLS